MAEDMANTARLSGWIERLQAGDESARGELIQHTYERLKKLTRKKLKGYSRLRRWDDTSDVLHNALQRLLVALKDVKPTSVREFFGLAALQIRRELIDLARHYYGRQGPGAHEEAKPRNSSQITPPDKPDTTHEPSRLAEWSEFHKQVSNLPQQEREVFDLLYYHELTQPETARILNVSKETVKARWRSARLRLHELIQGGNKG